MEGNFVLIGIDDTDEVHSPGTGNLARSMGDEIEKAGLGNLHSIVNHQLLLDKHISYTNHNNATSILIEIKSNIKEIIDFCRKYLIEKSEIGSAVGLCIAAWNEITSDIINWGKLAKMVVLKKVGALQLVECRNIYLEGLKGNNEGIIGSLAAIGLRKGGNDGKLEWLRGIDEMEGMYKVSEIKKMTDIKEIIDIKGQKIDENELIYIDNSFKPVIIEGEIVLIVEEERS